MAELVYIFCGITSLACVWLQVRAYRRTRLRLLLWSSLCFLGLSINNSLLFVDLVLFPEVFGITLFRTGVSLAGVSALIYGLVWDAA